MLKLGICLCVSALAVLLLHTHQYWALLHIWFTHIVLRDMYTGLAGGFVFWLTWEFIEWKANKNRPPN